MPEVTSHGTRINYDDQGWGKSTLLFMPGWCGSRSVFNHLIARCSTRHRTLALDWRGHGQSATPESDFGASDLVEDALSVIDASGAEHVVPVALSHSGWIAIELRRRLGTRVSELVLLDWIVTEASPQFLAAMQSLQDPLHWHQTRELLFSMWTHELDIPELTHYVHDDMGSFDFNMWSRAGREIASAYNQAQSPLHALAALAPPTRVLHLFAQPGDPEFFSAQQSFRTAHPWFHVHKVQARSHFPLLEAPDEMAAVIERFVT